LFVDWAWQLSLPHTAELKAEANNFFKSGDLDKAFEVLTTAKRVWEMQHHLGGALKDK